jgi:hypothetical protein
MTQEQFEEWVVLELLGHRKLAGRVREAVIAGGAFLRLDIPRADGSWTTQFYSPASVYAMTPTEEDTARAYAARHQPEPVHRYELPPASAEGTAERDPDGYDDGDLDGPGLLG